MRTLTLTSNLKWVETSEVAKLVVFMIITVQILSKLKKITSNWNINISEY